MNRPSIARRDWPGATAGRVFLAHATGFCKEVWGPVVDELHHLAWGGSATAWDAPGHGHSPPRAKPFDWWDAAEASLEVIRSYPSEGPRVGVGHSMGGATLAMVELLAPGSLDALILIEPIMFPPPFERVDQNPLAARTSRRRASFASPEEALDNFSSKTAFSAWDPRALSAYVDGGLVHRDGRWWLACEPELEADAYRSGTAHGAYGRLPEIMVPVLMLAGESSDTHPEPFVAHLAALVPDARYLVIPGAGHFLPMERPNVVAGQIIGVMEQLGAD